MEKVNTAPPCKDLQTHDFMNVDSFSQLPFLRPSVATTTTKSTTTAAGVRLFGIDFSSSTSPATANSDSDESTTDNHHEGGSPDPSTTNTNTAAISGGESGRRFECHYCCRNFPTSQALGGHQNAHKRERQHAKRAHLHHHHAAVISASGDHLYGYPHYYTSLTTNRTYSGFTQHRHNHQAPPTIDGSPLGVWRIPASSSMQLNGTYHRDRSLLLQRPGLYSGSTGSFSGPKIMMGRIENSGQVVGFDHHRTEHHQFNRRANGHENVSLDLRL